MVMFMYEGEVCCEMMVIAALAASSLCVVSTSFESAVQNVNVYRNDHRIREWTRHR
jgi:hypothetical protein